MNSLSALDAIVTDQSILPERIVAENIRLLAELPEPPKRIDAVIVEGTTEVISNTGPAKANLTSQTFEFIEMLRRFAKLL
jgi:hypothetical protein